MNICFEESRSIELFVDENNNIVIFPKTVTDIPMETPGYTPPKPVYRIYSADFPIELKAPYTKDELADKIRYGFEEWNKHPYFDFEKEKKTLEEKYYGIKGFKKAMKGKKYLDLQWVREYKLIDELINANVVRIDFPLKRGYAYFGIEWRVLPEKASWQDYAEAVIELLNLDFSKSERFKLYKSKLNL